MINTAFILTRQQKLRGYCSNKGSLALFVKHVFILPSIDRANVVRHVGSKPRSKHMAVRRERNLLAQVKINKKQVQLTLLIVPCSGTETISYVHYVCQLLKPCVAV